MKLVSNNFVSMDWDSDGFVDSKKNGFIAAVHKYGDTVVAFYEGKIYTHLNSEGTKSSLSMKDFVKVIKQNLVRKPDYDYPNYYEDYAEIYDGAEFNDCLADTLGLTEYKEDMIARLQDLSGYWQVVVQDL